MTIQANNDSARQSAIASKLQEGDIIAIWNVRQNEVSEAYVLAAASEQVLTGDRNLRLSSLGVWVDAKRDEGFEILKINGECIA